jgi:outer membrane receptor protein involved in Fe transport
VLSGVVRHEFNKVVADSNTPSVQHVTKTEEGNAYQFAVNYRPTDAIRVYAKYDHTYRFPATDEYAYYAFGLGGSSSNVFFNEQLRPEVSDNFELGSDYINGFWRVGGAVYRMNTVDEIAYNNNSLLNENIAKTKRTGVQSNVVYDRGVVGFRARADVVNARIIEDPINNTVGRVPLVPRWQTSETVFSRPLPKLMVELTHRYVGESSASPSSSGIISAVSFFDAKISYDITPAWFVYTGVNNLADTQSVGLNFFGGLYPNEGRFIYLGSTYKF